MSEGYKKSDIQRNRQKVAVGLSLTSKDMATAADNHRIELGFPAEKVTLVTTGNLAVSVQAKVGNGNSNAAINATTTVATTTLTNMASSLEISYTSGSGRLVILAK